jgi:hypothetical protein
VTCITTKPHSLSPHQHITHLGNPQVGWDWTRERVIVIASIEAASDTFNKCVNKMISPSCTRQSRDGTRGKSRPEVAPDQPEWSV